MTEEEKQPYFNKAEKDKVRFKTARETLLAGQQLSRQGKPLKIRKALTIIDGKVIKKPRSGYIRYAQMRLAENRRKTADEQLNNFDIMKLIGREWRIKMTDTDKKPW